MTRSDTENIPYPLVNSHIANWTMAIEIVDFPIENGARTPWVELLDAQLAAPVLGRTCRFDQVMGEKQPSNMNISLNISKPSLHMIMAVYISKQDINDIDIMKRNSMKHIKTIILHGGLIYSQLKKNITSIAIEHD